MAPLLRFPLREREASVLKSRVLKERNHKRGLQLSEVRNLITAHLIWSETTIPLYDLRIFPSLLSQNHVNALLFYTKANNQNYREELQEQGGYVSLLMISLLSAAGRLLNRIISMICILTTCRSELIEAMVAWNADRAMKYLSSHDATFTWIFLSPSFDWQ